MAWETQVDDTYGRRGVYRGTGAVRPLFNDPPDAGLPPPLLPRPADPLRLAELDNNSRAIASGDSYQPPTRYDNGGYRPMRSADQHLTALQSMTPETRFVEGLTDPNPDVTALQRQAFRFAPQGPESLAMLNEYVRQATLERRIRDAAAAVPDLPMSELTPEQKLALSNADELTFVTEQVKNGIPLADALREVRGTPDVRRIGADLIPGVPGIPGTSERISAGFGDIPGQVAQTFGAPFTAASEFIRTIPTGGGINLGERVAAAPAPIRIPANFALDTAPYVAAEIASGGALTVPFLMQAGAQTAQVGLDYEMGRIDGATALKELALTVGPIIFPELAKGTFKGVGKLTRYARSPEGQALAMKLTGERGALDLPGGEGLPPGQRDMLGEEALGPAEQPQMDVPQQKPGGDVPLSDRQPLMLESPLAAGGNLFDAPAVPGPAMRGDLNPEVRAPDAQVLGRTAPADIGIDPTSPQAGNLIEAMAAKVEEPAPATIRPPLVGENIPSEARLRGVGDVADDVPLRGEEGPVSPEPWYTNDGQLVKDLPIDVSDPYFERNAPPSPEEIATPREALLEERDLLRQRLDVNPMAEHTGMVRTVSRPRPGHGPGGRPKTTMRPVDQISVDEGTYFALKRRKEANGRPFYGEESIGSRKRAGARNYWVDYEDELYGFDGATETAETSQSLNQLKQAVVDKKALADVDRQIAQGGTEVTPRDAATYLRDAYHYLLNRMKGEADPALARDYAESAQQYADAYQTTIEAIRAGDANVSPAARELMGMADDATIGGDVRAEAPPPPLAAGDTAHDAAAGARDVAAAPQRGQGEAPGAAAGPAEVGATPREQAPPPREQAPFEVSKVPPHSLTYSNLRSEAAVLRDALPKHPDNVEIRDRLITVQDEIARHDERVQPPPNIGGAKARDLGGQRGEQAREEPARAEGEGAAGSGGGDAGGGAVPPAEGGEGGSVNRPPPDVAEVTDPPAGGNKYVRPLKPHAEVSAQVVTTEKAGTLKRAIQTVVARLGINPSLTADNPVSKALVAYARQRVAGESQTGLVVQAAWDAHQRRFIGTDLIPLTAKGDVTNITPKKAGASLDWHDVFSKPDAYGMTPQQRALIDDFNQVVAETEKMRTDAGLESRAKPRPDGSLYVPRQTSEVRGIEIRKRSKASLQRVYETGAEGRAAGIRYLGPRETLDIHVGDAYREVAQYQLKEAMEPYAKAPKDLIASEFRQAAENAGSRYARTAKAVDAIQRARRGEQLPPGTLKMIENVFPEIEANLSEASRITIKGLIEAGRRAEKEGIEFRRSGPKLLRGEQMKALDDALRQIRGTAYEAQTATGKRVTRYRGGLMEQLQRETVGVRGRYTRAVEAARNREVGPAALWGVEQAEEIPIAAWRNQFFPREWADKLAAAVGDYEGGRGATNPVARAFELAGNYTRFLVANFDFATPVTSGLPLLTRSPARWGRSTWQHYLAYFDPTLQARYMREHLETFQEMASEGTAVGDTEMFQALEQGGGASVLESLAKRSDRVDAARRVANFGGKQTIGRFQSSYSTFLAISRAELTEAYKTTIKDPAERQAQVRRMTGALDTRALGVTGNQRGIESFWLAFSPRLLRSTAALVGELHNPQTQAGRESWRALAQLAGGVTGIYIMAGIGLGKSREEIQAGLNPLAGKRYLAYRVNNDWIGVGGQMRAITQLLAMSITDPRSLTRKDRFNNPLLSFYSTRGAVGVSIGQTLAEGLTGYNADPYKSIDGIPDIPKHLATSALPFVVQNIAEGQGPVAVLSGATFARTSHVRPSEALAFAKDDAARQTGPYQNFGDMERALGPNAAEAAVRDNPQVAKARGERDAAIPSPYRDVQAVQREQQARLDERFESGALSPAQWRDERTRLNDTIAGQLYQVRQQQNGENKSTGDTVLDGYYAIFDEYTDKGVVTDREALNEALDRYTAGLSESDRQRLDANIGVGAATPKVQAYRDAVKQLSDAGYFNLADNGFRSAVWRAEFAKEPKLANLGQYESLSATRAAYIGAVAQRLAKQKGITLEAAQYDAGRAFDKLPVVGKFGRQVAVAQDSLWRKRPDLLALATKWGFNQLSGRERELLPTPTPSNRQ